MFLSQTVLCQEKQYGYLSSTYEWGLQPHLEILHIYNFEELKDQILTEAAKGAIYTF